jgi:diguanylate cyclase (GGDEF)-like protein/PAS domain S-box-containing protein
MSKIKSLDCRTVRVHPAVRAPAQQDQLALLREAIEHMHLGLCMYDAEDRIVACNRRYAHNLLLCPDAVVPGITRLDLVKLGIEAGHYPAGKSADEILRDLRQTFREAGENPVMMRRRGRTYAVWNRYTPDGCLVATSEDVTSQIEAERAVRESERGLRAILDAMPDCVNIFDKDGRLIHINPKGLELLQAPDFDALVSTPGYVPVPPEYRRECIEVHRRVLAGETVVWTYEIVGMKGRRRHVEAHAVPFRMPDGARAHMCISRDVDERVEAENTLRRSEERLRVVQEATRMAEFETDQHGLVSHSGRFFEQIGLPFQDRPIPFREWLDLVHPDDRERLEAEITRGLHEEDWVNSEFRIVRADNGEVRWLSTHFAVQRDDTGKPVRTVGAHVDITRRKLAEKELRASAERLRLVKVATGLGDFEAGPDGVAKLSERFVELTGLPAGTTQVTFDQWLAIIHPHDRDWVRKEILNSVAARETFQSEFRIIRPDNGEVRWISSHTKMERDAEGHTRTIGAHLDITERMRTEEALRESEERFRLAAEAAGLGIWDYDVANDRREWSDRLRDIFGFEANAVPSLAVAEACVHPSDRASFMRTLQAARSGDLDRFQCTVRIRRANDGELRWVTMNGWRTYKSDKELRRIIMTMRDVTEEKTAEERVRWTANHDALTRLANRSLFSEKLDQAIRAAADGGTVGLLLLDMDDFKQVNDTLGHDAGDRMLAMFADRLRTVVREGDTVARLGGDEFAVVLPDIDGAPDLMRLTRSIQQRLREPFTDEGRLLDCRVSMGASVYPVHGRTSAELLKTADIALYASKASGRSSLSLFEPRMGDGARRRAAMVELAREAIRDDRIVPYYQPKLDLVTRRLVGFEALLRWRRPNGSIASPAALEAAFEDLEVAASLSDRMVERVVADVRHWLDRGVAFEHVAINASAAELRRDDFAERLLDALGEADVPTRCIQLEVTETVFLGRGAEYVHRALALLSARGVKIALDDFGTGYASLRHLKQFPVDIIKVDQSFVQDMNMDPGDEAIVRAVINLGHSLGIKVVAEGIENEQQAERLIELSCDFGQGFLYSRAIPARRVPKLAARWGPIPAATPASLRLVASRG